MKLIITFITILIISSNAAARLAITDFKSMVHNSDLIILAAPIKVTRSQTIFEVLHVYKGVKREEKEITIFHSNEVHEQHIKHNGKHILFLKKSKTSKWASTSYGRSYWPLLKSSSQQYLDDTSCDFATPYVYPFTLIETDKYISISNRKIFFNYTTNSKQKLEAEVFCKGDIERAIAKTINTK